MDVRARRRRASRRAGARAGFLAQRGLDVSLLDQVVEGVPQDHVIERPIREAPLEAALDDVAPGVERARGGDAGGVGVDPDRPLALPGEEIGERAVATADVENVGAGKALEDQAVVLGVHRGPEIARGEAAFRPWRVSCDAR